MTNLLDDLHAAAAAAADTVGAATVSIGRSARGSGLVVGEDRVLTNAHNLRDRTTRVGFGDHVEQGEVLAVDAASDLVVLRVDTSGITPIEWSDDLPGVGAAVFALARSVRGSRLGVGFVSGTDRWFRGPGGRPIGGAIEHTAPMARGSSGGPLVDASGRVVGINTHRLGEGFYLAQAADRPLVERIDALSLGRTPQRAVLGVAVAPAEVARRLRRSVGLDDRDGVLIRGVEDDSPAQRADLRVGDLVVATGTAAVTSIDDLHRALDGHDPEAPLELTVVRGADQLAVTVTFVGTRT